MLRPDEELDEAQIAFFDQLAALTTNPDAGFAELTARCRADSRLTVPGPAISGGKPPPDNERRDLQLK